MKWFALFLMLLFILLIDYTTIKPQTRETMNREEIVKIIFIAGGIILIIKVLLL